MLKTTVIHEMDLNPASTAPAGNLNIAASQDGGVPLPHNGAGYFSLGAIPSCQWNAYSLLYEQVQFRGVKIVYPLGPQRIDASAPSTGGLEAGAVLHAFDADSAELEGYGTLLSRPNHSRRQRSTNDNSRKEASMYLVPRTLSSQSGVAQAVVARKRMWFDLQATGLDALPFYGYKWWIQPNTTTVEPNPVIFYITYYLAFRAPRGCDSAGQILQQIQNQPNVVSAHLVPERPAVGGPCISCSAPAVGGP